MNDAGRGVVARVMLASARALLAAGEADAEEAPFADPAAVGMEGRVRGLVASLPRDRRWLLTLGCLTIDCLARLRGFRRYDRLDPPRARELLDHLQASRLALLRRTSAVVRMLALYAYFCGADSWPLTGYDGPWLGRLEIETLPPPALGGGGMGEHEG